VIMRSLRFVLALAVFCMLISGCRSGQNISLIAAKPVATNPDIPFEVVSTKRVDYADGVAGSSVSWKSSAVTTGLVVVLKRKSFDKAFIVYSADYSLHVLNEDTASMIHPARPVTGVSSGMRTPDENPSWLLSPVSATNVDAGCPYFALLFETSKAYQDFSLRYVLPTADGIKVTVK